MGSSPSLNLNVLVMVGSLRRQSYNRGLVNCLVQSPEFKSSGINTFIPDLGQIPFYNQDYEDDKSKKIIINQEIPEKVNELVKMCVQSDILVFSTPQYNGSVSPILKNAFDWLSRPSPIYQNKVPVFGKKAALMSTSYVSQEQLRDCQKMGAYRKLIYMEKRYYVNLGSNVFDRNTGLLNDKNEQERLLNWGKEVVQFTKGDQGKKVKIKK